MTRSSDTESSSDAEYSLSPQPQAQAIYRRFFYFILFTILVIPTDILLMRWLNYYIDCTISPLSHQSKVTNQEYYTLETDFICLCILGIPAGFINVYFIAFTLDLICNTLGICKFFIDPPYRDGQKSPLSFWGLCHSNICAFSIVTMFTMFAMIYMSMLVFMPTRAWEHKYEKTCNGLDIRVFLDSSSSRPAWNILFADLVSRASYRMVMSPDPAIWGLDDHGVYNFSVVSSHGPHGNGTFTPGFERIKYDMASRTLEAYNQEKTYISSFNLGENFSIPTLGLYGDTGPFSRRCVFDPTVEIFNDTAGEEGKKSVVMRTVQFTVCGELQVCADQRVKDDVAIVVGLLVLQRAGRPDGCCKGCMRLAFGGRDSGRDGMGPDGLGHIPGTKKKDNGWDDIRRVSLDAAGYDYVQKGRDD